MINTQQIVTQLSQFTAGNLAFEDFEDWVIRESWNVRFDDPIVERLIYGIELRIAEYTSGHLDDAGLREELLGLLNAVPQTVS